MYSPAEPVVHLAHESLALAAEDVAVLELAAALELPRQLGLALAHALLERPVERARLAQRAHEAQRERRAELGIMHDTVYGMV